MIKDLGHFAALICEVTLMAIRGTESVGAASLTAVAISSVFVAAVGWRVWRKFDAGEYARFVIPS
jgi:hypothetical protein